MIHHDALFAIQLAVIVMAAKLFGRVCERFLKQPSVIGEVLAGVVVGPFALGGIPLPWVGPLFPLGHGGEVEESLHSLALVASVVLLFLAGLESDLRKFLRFAVAGLATGLGGAVVSFVLGDLVTVWLGGATSFTDPKALFMGTLSTATSVGLTARVLADKHKMDTPEGATILSAAVVDDVIGLIILGAVVSMSVHHGKGGGSGIPWAHIGWITAKAAMIWVVMVGVGVLLAHRIAGFLKMFGSIEAIAAAALALALFMAGVSESAGMALIVGAYVMGLSLSETDLRHELQRELSGIYHVFVPMFFCVSGMMVNLQRIPSVLVFGLAFTALATVGKVIGCGLPALPLGFNLRGALRIGVGMVPRMEVGLIVAAIALRHKVIGTHDMGAVLLMTLVTAIGPPPVLWLLFDSRSGCTATEDEVLEEMVDLRIPLPGAELAGLVMDRMVSAFGQEQFFAHHLPAGIDVYELRKDDKIVYVKVEGNDVVFSARPHTMQYVRLIALEEMLTLDQIFSDAARLSDMDHLKRSLLTMQNAQV